VSPPKSKESAKGKLRKTKHKVRETWPWRGKNSRLAKRGRMATLKKARKGKQDRNAQIQTLRQSRREGDHEEWEERTSSSDS